MANNEKHLTVPNQVPTAPERRRTSVYGQFAHAEHGPLIDHKIPQEEAVQAEPDLLWSRIRCTLREPFSEFFGVFILILFGDGVVAQVVLSKGTKGSYQSISWGWGLGVMLGVYTGGISGAHLNPAVTFANCVFRKFPWRKFPKYLIAQTLGAMCAAGVVYANYKSAIDVFEGGPNIRTVGLNTSTAGIFCTYPASFMTRTGMFFSEFIASTILMFCIYALKDDGNLGAGNLTPLGLFFVIFGIGACFGWETGYAINLARDFGPRLMSYFLGYGHGVWSAGGYYFWVRDLLVVSVCNSTDNRPPDTDGCSLLRLHLWRLALRHVPLHRREPDQYSMDGTEASAPSNPCRVVKHCCQQCGVSA
jgi:aquaglyceroporin related protein, other eukaryote